MARAATEMLVAAIRRKEPVKGVDHRLLDFTLIRRQSDAAPRRRPRTIAS